MNNDERPERFMILASARTGSNFLLSLLSDHALVRMYGELFNLDTLSRNELVEALDDPIQYLRKRVYRPHSRETRAVGFKMFYEHLTPDYFSKPIDPAETSRQLKKKFIRLSTFLQANYSWPMLNSRFRDTWNFLIDDRALGVIHLKRRNMMNTLVSLKAAYISDVWWRLNGIDPRRTTGTLHLDPDECRRYFHRLDESIGRADRAFRGHRKLEVMYENLLEKRETELLRVFKFLDIPYQPVSTRMRKQITVPVSELVDNYDQLKEYFQQTKWNLFFE